MAITPLPTPPLRSDPTNFAARGDAFLGALPQFQVEANALAAAMNLNSTTDSSTSSITIGTGAKTFVVSSGKSFQPGMYLVIADTAAPSTNSMFGQTTAYSGTSLVMSIISVRGSGTKSSWVISQSSAGGAQAGPLASSGITGAAASGVNTDIISITGNAATATTSGSGSDNAFLTAGTGASGAENLIGARCSGYGSIYLYNNAIWCGLYSTEGGLLIDYNRGSGKTQMYGNAATATTATTALNALGVGQTWQAVTRVVDTIYTNSTGRSIDISFTVAHPAGMGSMLSMNGAQHAQMSNSASSVTTYWTYSTIIPDGKTYYVTGGAGVSITNARELR